MQFEVRDYVKGIVMHETLTWTTTVDLHKPGQITVP